MNPGLIFRDLRFKLFNWLVNDVITRRARKLKTFGDICPWTIQADTLDAKSVVLSAGAGNDISFERDLIEQYQLNIVLMDPSPTGKICVEKTVLSPDRLKFLPLALTAKDGVIHMRAPQDPVEGSYVATGDNGVGDTFESESIVQIMRKNNWKQIDLLKMDIEGSEYEVLDQILISHLNIRQICVELHYGTGFQESRSTILKTILRMVCGGYDLVHRVGMDFTFVRRAQ